MNNKLERTQSTLHDAEELGHACGFVVTIAALAAGITYLISSCK